MSSSRKRALAGKIAVVAGATRGAGRGIARMLGEAGATVYCTGRSVRGAPASGEDRPETIEETAELVTADGGQGLWARVDHTKEDEVRSFFERVRREQGGNRPFSSACWTWDPRRGNRRWLNSARRTCGDRRSPGSTPCHNLRASRPRSTTEERP